MLTRKAARTAYLINAVYPAIFVIYILKPYPRKMEVKHAPCVFEVDDLKVIFIFLYKKKKNKTNK